MPRIESKDFHWFQGVKLLVAYLLFTHLSFWMAVLIGAVLSMSFPHVVAKAKGLNVMQVGDFNTFITNAKAPTNIMTATPLSAGRPEYAKEVFMRIVKAHVKARSCIVKVLGDMYYKELDM